MKETRLINRFYEKILIQGNGSFWVQKLHILITLDPLEEFFKVDENDINNIQKNFWGQIDHFGPKNGASS